jgi:hypothetical protein
MLAVRHSGETRCVIDRRRASVGVGEREDFRERLVPNADTLQGGDPALKEAP